MRSAMLEHDDLRERRQAVRVDLHLHVEALGDSSHGQRHGLHVDGHEPADDRQILLLDPSTGELPLDGDLIRAARCAHHDAARLTV